MGESKHLNILNKETDKKYNIDNILNTNEIKIVEQINEKFINKTIIYFSDFIKYYIKLNVSSIQINSYTNNDKYIKYLFCSEIKILNSSDSFFIFFSDNLLSVFIDLMFGGNGNCVDKINKERDLTYTEKITSQKILQLIFDAYQQAFQKFFSIDMLNIKTNIINIEKISFSKMKFMTSYFSLNLNGVNVFLSILFPLQIIKKNIQETIMFQFNKESLKKNIHHNKNISIIESTYDVELNIITKLITSSQLKYNALSIGDILIIESPDQVVSYIEQKPIFLSHYKNFNQKSVIFFKNFIDKNLDFDK